MKKHEVNNSKSTNWPKNKKVRTDQNGTKLEKYEVAKVRTDQLPIYTSKEHVFNLSYYSRCSTVIETNQIIPRVLFRYKMCKFNLIVVMFLCQSNNSNDKLNMYTMNNDSNIFYAVNYYKEWYNYYKRLTFHFQS